MKLEETLESDLVQAMKAKDAEKLGVLRMVKAALLNFKIDKKKEILTDEDVVEIIQKQAKQRRESIDSFEKAGRKDLADKEKSEIVFLQAYLPKQLSDDEIKTLAQQVIAKTGAKSKAQTGLVMKDLMPLVKGKADGKKVNKILARLLP
jgi:uncharacterized protein YqeY